MTGAKDPSKKPKRPKDPQKTKRRESAVPQGIMNRASRLAATSIKGSFRLAMIGPRAVLGRDSTKQLIAELHANTAQDLVGTLGRLKGASMKVGQLASFIDAGVLPPEIRDLYQQTLASLRDAAPPMDPKLVKQVFIREFDEEPDNLFAEFSMAPVAAASLGQVHLATTHDGREVAVKIQYPGIESAIRSDLAVTAAVKPLMPLLAPGLDADEAMDEIRERVLEECDYVVEAQSLDFLAEQYASHPFIWIPRSIPELSARRVLTMERVRGTPFDQVMKLPQDQRDRFGEMLFRFYYGSLHRYGFTSADPHPGNYMLGADGKLACFDFGLACVVPPEIRREMHGGLVALSQRDVQAFYDFGRAMKYIPNPEAIDPQRFFDWAWFSLAPIREDREYRFSRDFIAERTAAMLDVRNPWWGFIRKLNLPRWAILLYRLELGLFAVLAQLEASANWHAITMEFYTDVDPTLPSATTELGRLERDWLSAS